LDASEGEGKPLDIEVSAGGVVVRKTAGGHEVALAEQDDRNTREATVRLPKGHLEDGETAEQAALREVEEEIGLVARIVAPLGEVSYIYTDRALGCEIDKRVVFYLMSWERGDAQAADGEMTRVFWTPIAGAARQLSFESERDVVQRAHALLESEHPPVL
jgi:8-oxo-dGTP pyrophosphatase MutT (NUDIX family)